MRPGITPGIHWVEASHDSVAGPTSGQWRRAGNRFELNVVIPAGATATIYLPAKDAASITEGRQPLAATKEVRVLRFEGNTAVLSVESGAYSFASRLAPGVTVTSSR